MKRWLLAVTLALAACATSYGDLRIPERQDRTVVFAGREVAVEVRVENEAAEVMAVPIEYRLFQIANRLIAPLGERKPWKKVSLLAGQTAIERLTIEIPEVRAVSRFRVVFYSGAKELGHRTLIAVPQTLFVDFSSPLACEGDLANVLRGLGLKVCSLDEADPSTFAILHPKDASAVGEVRSRAKALVVRGVPSIVLLPEREFAHSERGALHSLSGLVANGRGRLLIAKQLDLAQLEKSAEAQLSLYQLLSLASSSDEFPWIE